MSLVELMIAMTISLILLGAVAGIFVSTSKARNEVERSSRQIENGRYAAEIISDDLRLAGFYGELDVGAITPAATLPADPCSVNAADWIAAIPVHVQGYNDVAAAPGTCVMPNLKTGTDVLVVRRVQTCLAGVDGCAAEVGTRPYLQVSQCNDIPPPPSYLLTLGAVAASLKLKSVAPCAACTCAVTVPRRRYLVNIYFISTDNGAGVSVPTLKRLELTGAGWVETPLVEGIEQLQLEYGIDSLPAAVPPATTPGDGAPDSYTSAPATVDDWMNVVTAQFYILARNIDTSPGYADSKTYQLGSKSVSGGGDGYRRHVFSGLVRITNPASRRDKP